MSRRYLVWRTMMRVRYMCVRIVWIFAGGDFSYGTNYPRFCAGGQTLVEARRREFEAPWSRGVSQNRGGKTALILSSKLRRDMCVVFCRISWKNYDCEKKRSVCKDDLKRLGEETSRIKSIWHDDHRADSACWTMSNFFVMIFLKSYF